MKEKTAFPAGIGIKWQTHTLIKLHKCMHLGFLSYQVLKQDKGLFWREKIDRRFGLCMQMSVWNIVCARGLIFFHFPRFWGIVKSGQIFSPITRMMLLFLAQWGLTLIREGTKCCFSSCLAVWGLKEVKEGRGKTGSGGNLGVLVAIGAHRWLSLTTQLPLVTCLMFFFFQQKLRNVFLSSNFFLLEDVQCPALSVKSLFFLSSSSLQLLIFFIKRLDYSSLLSFTNQGPFVWKREDKNMQQKPLKAILMMCLCVICVIDYHIRVD